MNADYLLLTGIQDLARLERYFSSSMVDVAYLEALSEEAAKVVVESATDLRNETDLIWIMDLINGALELNEEDQARIEVVLGPPGVS